MTAGPARRTFTAGAAVRVPGTTVRFAVAAATGRYWATGATLTRWGPHGFTASARLPYLDVTVTRMTVTGPVLTAWAHHWPPTTQPARRHRP